MQFEFTRTLAARLAAILFVSSASLLAVGPADGADTWPQWRGPDRNGRVQEPAWPNDLSKERLAASWSVPQGPSYSGPIVAADRVFVTETKNRKYEVVRALDRTTGKQIWETQWEGAMSVPFFAAANGSWIRATPAFDGERLYVAGIRDVLVCLEAETGKKIWTLDFVKQTGSNVPGFGFVSSPLIHGDHVYVQAGASLAKIDKMSGKIVWQALKDSGGMFGSAFSSPVIGTLAGVEQLIVQTRSELTGVSIEDGSKLWGMKIPAFRGMNILTPTLIGDHIFTSSYGGRSTMFKVTRSNSAWQIEQVWSHKSQGYMSSPVVIDGHIYLHLRNQRFVCLKADNGAEQWTSKPFGKYCSMVANGKQLLALDQRGELLLIEATPDEFRLIDRREVASDSWAHLAICRNEIFIRDLKATKRFEWK